MKLTFKDLKQQKFVIEAEPSELISDVKEKISKEKGWEASLQKLIYSGKILQDANTVESYKIEEKGFIVCMIQKPKAAPAASSSTSTPSKAPATPAPAVASTPAPPAAPVSQTGSSTTSNVPATPSPAGTGATASSGVTMGTERAAQIAEMESMGFPRPQIDAAMRAAFYNSERAIEYLLNGIPENLQQEQRAPPPAAASAPAETPSNPAGGDAAEGEDEPVNLFEAAQRGASGGGAPGGGAGNLFGAAAAAGAIPGAGAAPGGLGNLDFLRDNAQFQQ